LLAWFLLGWTARALIIRLAAFVGNADDIYGLLILPVAVLVQLAAYIGMFLAIRRELPHLNRVDDVETGEAAPSATRRWRETLLAGILPFFLLYVAWNFIYDDMIDYFSSALNQADLFGGGRVASLASFGVMSVTLVVVAFALRWLLGRFSTRLPRWSSAIATYLEAVWVFVALTVIQTLLVGVPAWLASRRMFAWAVDGWASLVDSLPWFASANEIVGWMLGQAGTLIGLPLAWLAIASIVYFATLPRSTGPASGAVAKVSERWSRMPVWARRIGMTVSSGLVDRWGPVTLAARLIWRSGPIALGTYLLGFAVVTAAGEWLSLVVYRLLGPHDTGWWFGASDAVQLGVAAITAVLQVCLVAAAFDQALRSDEAERLIDEAGDAVSSAAAPAADLPTS
jgi:hypothetical protein